MPDTCRHTDADMMHEDKMKYKLSLPYKTALLGRDGAIAFLLSSLILFYVVKVLTITQIEFHPTIYRVTYTQIFNDAITVSLFADSMIVLGLGLVVLSLLVNYRKYIIGASALIFFSVLVTGLMQYTHLADLAALSTVPAITTLFILNKTLARNLLVRKINVQTLAITTLVIISVFELVVLVRWASYPLFPTRIYGDWSWSAAILDYKVFYAFGLLSPFVMLIMLYAFLYKPSLKNAGSFITNKITGLRAAAMESSITYEDQHRSNYIFSKKNAHRWILASSLALASLFAFYPYLPSINPDLQIASVDVPFYVEWLDQLRNDHTSDSLLQKAFVEINNGDRPLTLLLMLGMQSLTGLSPQIVAMLFPVVLGPMLVGTVYHFVKSGTSNKNMAALSALLTIASFHFVVGMYAGFFANWLALITSYLSFLFLLRSWKKPSKLAYLAFTSFTILTLFTHAYTWGYLMASIVLFLIISCLMHRKERVNMLRIGILGAIVVANVSIDLARTTYLGAVSGIQGDLGIAQTGTGVDQFLARWNNLQYTFEAFVGGYFTNVAMLVLAFLWVLKARYDNTFDRILLASIFVGALPIIFGNFAMQTRIFYNLPIHIPAALMLYNVSNNYNTHPLLGSFLSLAVVAHFFNYALRSIANLYLIP